MVTRISRVALNSFACHCLTDNLTVLFCSSNPLALQSAVSFGYYKQMTKRHALSQTSYNHIKISMHKSMCALMCKYTPFNEFNQKPQDFMGPFFTVCMAVQTLLMHYKLLVLVYLMTIKTAKVHKHEYKDL